MEAASSAKLEHPVAGIILAGSYQWNASPFERLRPRPLMPVALRPIIGHVLEWFESASVPRAVVCANGLTPVIQRQLGTAYSSSLAIAYHEDPTPRGAAGCVKDAAAHVEANVFLVTDGTSIPTADAGALVRRHVESGADLTIVVNRQAGPHAGLDHFGPTGTYVFSRSVLEVIPATSFHDIKETLIPRLYRDGRRIETFEVEDASPRALNVDSYVALNRWYLARLAASGGNADIVDAHSSAEIERDAVLIGPVVLGAGARVLDGATIVGPTVVGAGTTIHGGATVARSVLWNDCEVGARAFVDQCLLAEGASVMANEAVSSVVRMQELNSDIKSRFSFANGLGVSRPVARPALS